MAASLASSKANARARRRSATGSRTAGGAVAPAAAWVGEDVPPVPEEKLNKACAACAPSWDTWAGRAM